MAATVCELRSPERITRPFGKAAPAHTGGVCELDPRGYAIDARVVACNHERPRIYVAGKDRPMQCLGGGDGENAGAGADVEDASPMPASRGGGRVVRGAAATPILGNAVKRKQASTGAAVMAGAEGKSGLDLNADLVGSNAAPMIRAMDDKAAGINRL
jgi:hypothetical protein